MENNIHMKGVVNMDIVSLILVIIGALNLLLVGLFQFDLVAAIFGGQSSVWARIIYSLIGLAGIWCISFFGKINKSKR